MGIFFLSLLSVVMSTIDSFIFICGFTIGKDLIKVLADKDSSIRYIQIGIVISGVFSVILASFFTHAIDIWYTVGSFVVPALLIPLLLIYFKIDLQQPFLCMIVPLIVTGIWFIYGRIHIDPMYPGLITSGILCLFNKKTI